MAQLRRITEGTQIEEAHMRNRQMIVHWLMENTDAVEVKKRDGKTFYVMADVDAWREGVGRFWPRCSGSSRKAIAKRPRR
jgi:dipeptidyl-peptidase-3